MAIITQYQCDATGEIFQNLAEVVQVEVAVYSHQGVQGYRTTGKTERKLLSVKKAQQLGLLPLKSNEAPPEVELTFGQKLEILMRDEMQAIADDAAYEAVQSSRN